jgi:hypothetical protein
MSMQGLTWHFCRPPAVNLEYEMDCGGVLSSGSSDDSQRSGGQKDRGPALPRRLQLPLQGPAEKASTGRDCQSTLRRLGSSGA